MNLISLSPDITEIIAHLGLQSQLVGRSSECDFPSSLQTLPEVGNSVSADIEKIISLNPDLVFTSNFNSPDVAKSLAQNHIPFISLNAYTLMDIPKHMVHIGRLLGSEKIGIEKANQWISEFSNLKFQGARTVNRQSAYFEEWGEPVTTGFRMVGEILEFSGFEVLFADQKTQRHPENRVIDLAEFKNLHFDVAFWGWKNSGSSFDLHSEIEKRNRRIGINKWNDANTFAVDSQLFNRPGPRILDGMREILKLRAIVEATGPASINLDYSAF